MSTETKHAIWQPIGNRPSGKTCDTVVMGHSVAEAIEFEDCTHTHRTHVL